MKGKFGVKLMSALILASKAGLQSTANQLFVFWGLGRNSPSISAKVIAKMLLLSNLTHGDSNIADTVLTRIAPKNLSPNE